MKVKEQTSGTNLQTGKPSLVGVGIAGPTIAALKKVTLLSVGSYTVGVIAAQQNISGGPIMRDDFITQTGPLGARV